MNDTEYLAHYGVKGMRWGVRRDLRRNQRLANASKRYSDKASRAYAKGNISKGRNLDARSAKARNRVVFNQVSLTDQGLKPVPTKESALRLVKDAENGTLSKNADVHVLKNSIKEAKKRYEASDPLFKQWNKEPESVKDAYIRKVVEKEAKAQHTTPDRVDKETLFNNYKYGDLDQGGTKDVRGSRVYEEYVAAKVKNPDAYFEKQNSAYIRYQNEKEEAIYGYLKQYRDLRVKTNMPISVAIDSELDKD